MFRICKIIVESKQDASSLKEYLGGYPVEITTELSEERYFEVPTLMIGWNSVKNSFPYQKINEEFVTENLIWTYNQKEISEVGNDLDFYKKIDSFVNENLQKWLPSDVVVFDSIINGSFSKFIEESIDKEEISYIHFNKGAMYVRNSGNDFIINVKNLYLTEQNYRNTLSKLLNDLNCMVYSYNGIEDYVNLDELGNLVALDILRWIKFGVETPKKYFQIIPNTEIDKYIPFMMSKINMESLELSDEEKVFFDRMCFRDKMARWMSTRYISFSYNFKKNLNFIYRDNAKLARINYSTKRTITGRITSSDRYNPQNLEKEGSDRTFIVSRYRGGRIYQFDYTSFEARIALYLCDDEEFMMNYYDKDLHSETAIIIFDTIDFTPEQRDLAKLVNHAILYGAGEATVLKKLEGLENPEDKMLNVRRFLHPIFKKAKELMELAEEQGYIINKWGSIIKPEKSYAGFNNYIQSTASEIIVDKVYDLKNILNGFKSQFLFQVHDSIVVDIHPDEVFLVNMIAESLSYHKGMLFSVNFKSGENYRDLSSESVYF